MVIIVNCVVNFRKCICENTLINSIKNYYEYEFNRFFAFDVRERERI